MMRLGLKIGAPVVDVRHQVFISSTFLDLQAERSEVIQAVLELGCFPAGMEAFVASDDSQWEIIKGVISDSDYYVIIVAGRYGSVDERGISYTEREFDLAVELGVPIMAFVRADIENIPAKNAELNPQGRERLDAFRARVCEGRVVKFWSNGAELGGHVSRGLINAMRTHPRAGWIRNDRPNTEEQLEQINKLLIENAELKRRMGEVQSASQTPSPLLAQGRDKVRIAGEIHYRNKDEYFDVHNKRKKWSAEVTWDYLMSLVGPMLSSEASETEIYDKLRVLYFFDESVKDLRDNYTIASISVYQDIFGKFIIQLRALGYLAPGVKKRGIQDKERYWVLTPEGDQYLVGLLATKRAGDQTQVEAAPVTEPEPSSISTS